MPSSDWVKSLMATADECSRHPVSDSVFSHSVVKAGQTSRPLGSRVRQSICSDKGLEALSLFNECSLSSFDSYNNTSLRISDYGSKECENLVLDFINVASNTYEAPELNTDLFSSTYPSSKPKPPRSPAKTRRTEINKAYFDARSSELLAASPRLRHSTRTSSPASVGIASPSSVHATSPLTSKLPSQSFTSTPILIILSSIL
ncbi:hypothetical protein GEMRC1_002274 [Eukaryota sp. GEM-RC1]